MVDHHVDRPGVDAQQCVQLTGPNRSIGSILPARKSGEAEPVTHSGKNRSATTRLSSFATRMTAGRSQAKLATVKTTTPTPHEIRAAAAPPLAPSASLLAVGVGVSLRLTPGIRFDGLVATARGNTPDPIPNSAVKTLSANGTAS